MALVASQAGTQSWVATGTQSISVSVAAGDVLAFIVGASDPATTVTNVTDNLGGTWTAGPSSPVSTGNMRGATFYKVCAGGETSISFDIGVGTTGQAFAVKVTGFTGTATLEGTPGEDESKLSTTGKTVTSGSTTNTTASAAVIALFAADRGDLVSDVSRSYSNSFTEVGFNTTSGSRAGAFAAAKILSGTGANTTTFTTGDTGDEMYGAILVFGDATGGSSYTLAVDKADLTLSGKVITFNASLGVTEGDLTATGQAIAFAQTLAVGNGTLTLAGQDVTLTVSGSYTLPVDKGTLTLAAQTVTFDLGFGVTKQDLALAGSDAAFGSALLIDGGTLALAGQNVTLVTDALPEEAPVVIGGHYFPTVKLNDWKERSAKQRREFLERLLGLVEDMPEVVEEEIQELIEAQNIVSLDTARVSRLIAQIERILEDEDETVFLLMAS